MEDDAQALDRIARQETRDRVENIVSAWREHPMTPAWPEVYRHAHTLAGIADVVAADVADAARDLATRLRDERGHFVELTEEDWRHVADDVARMEAWLKSASSSPFASAAGAPEKDPATARPGAEAEPESPFRADLRSRPDRA